MIFVAGTLSLKPEAISGFVADVAVMRPKVLHEAGCHHYSLLVENAAAGTVNVLEMWDDDDALVVHLAQPWITAFFATYSPQMTGSTVRIFDIGAERPLPGM